MLTFNSRSTFVKNLSNIPGWRTTRKLVIIESDDWGSIRMPDIGAFDELERAGLDLRSADAERFNMNDTLASASDLECLYEVLNKYKDISGNRPVVTAISIMANPDFRKIAESNFSEYYYELFPETLLRYTGDNKAFSLWKEGIRNKLFIPQLHGREHLNVAQWMKALSNNDSHTFIAFTKGVTGFVPRTYPLVDYQAAFLFTDPGEMFMHTKIINESVRIFEKLFGYRAEYFVPPNGRFNNNLNKALIENGIKIRSVAKIQHEPKGNGKTRKVFHWLGQKDKHGIRYITRNCLFEPCHPGKDWVSACLRDIEIAFQNHKPAIISTHRVNYIGGLNPANRDKGLNQLSGLLQGITGNWPGVEFITTPVLGSLMNAE